MKWGETRDLSCSKRGISSCSRSMKANVHGRPTRLEQKNQRGVSRNFVTVGRARYAPGIIYEISVSSMESWRVCATIALSISSSFPFLASYIRDAFTWIDPYIPFILSIRKSVDFISAIHKHVVLVEPFKKSINFYDPSITILFSAEFDIK